MTSRRSPLGLRVAQVTAVALSLSLLTWLVIDAQARHNPTPQGPPDSENPVHDGTNGLTAAGQASGTAQNDTEGGNTVFLPTSKSLVVDPAFLSTSKSMVLNTATSGAEAEAFLFSSKSAVLPEGIVQGNTPPTGTTHDPAFLPSSKSEVFLFSSKSAVLPEAAGPGVALPPGTEPTPAFLPSSKSLAPQLTTPKVQKPTSTSKASAASKAEAKKGQSKKKPDPKR